MSCSSYNANYQLSAYGVEDRARRVCFDGFGHVSVRPRPPPRGFSWWEGVMVGKGGDGRQAGRGIGLPVLMCVLRHGWMNQESFLLAG